MSSGETKSLLFNHASALLHTSSAIVALGLAPYSSQLLRSPPYLSELRVANTI